MNEIVKICKIHGDLTELQVKKETTSKGYITFRCHQCKIDKDRRWKDRHREQHNLSACTARNKARKDYKERLTTEEPKANVWGRNDRKENPEKYKKYEANYIAKHGMEKIRKYEVLRIHELSIEEYEKMILEQNNTCAICKKPEKRLARSGLYIAPLCLDHCHNCKDKGQHIIRGLLCHNCNSAMGKLDDNIDILKSMISYLERHKHID